MALVVKDRVKETTTTTGTGTITLGGAVSGFQTFTSVLSNADTTYYAIIDYVNNDFEVGLGTFTSSGTTLARTTILESSNSGSAVDLESGTKEVFITYPAEKSVYLDASNQLVINGTATTSTAAELSILDGDTSATSTTVADADRVVLNDNGTMKQVAVTDLSAYFDDEITAMPNLVTTAATTVGALNSGSITSGFGSIDNGSSAITTTGTITYGSLSDGSITVTAFVDEDNMSSNSATLIPTQQSVKAYVDSQVTAQDLDATTDSGTIDIDLDSETLTIAGGEGIDTSATGTTITIAGEEATTSNKGVASFSSTFFSVSSGAVSLAAAQTGLTSVLNTSLVIGRDADNDIDFATDNNIIFRASGADQIKLQDGVLLPVTDNDIDLGSSSYQFKDAHINGTLEADAITVDGTALNEYIADTAGAMFSSNTETGVTVTYQDGDNTIDVAVDAAQTTITSLLATDIKIGEDDQTKIDFETADEIHFYAANAEQVYVADGIFGPQTDSDVDLGTNSVRWKDAYIDTVTSTTFTGALTGNAATATLASTVTVSDSTANTNFPVVFHDESNALLDDTGALRYNPSTGELLVPKLTVAGTTSVVDTVTMNAANAIVFEGATADAYETTLSIVDPTADHTQYLINQGGYIPVLAAATTTAITSTPAELNVLDNVTAGTVSASLGVVVDSNKDIGSFRNVTLTGELDAATLDISGNADIDGTTNLDAVDIDGATQIDATVTVGVDDTGYDVKFFGATSGAYMLWDESADDLKLVGAAGLTVAGDIDIDGTSNLDVVDIDGAVDMASTLGVSGVVTANAGVVVDNITIDGTEIDLSSGDFTLDVAGHISLDADDGGHVRFKDGGTQYASIYVSSSNTVIDTSGSGDLTLDVAGDITLDADGGNILFKDGGTEFLEFEQDGGGCTIRADAANTDLKFVGNDSDGGGAITALTLDMSAAGAATFNSTVTSSGYTATSSGSGTVDGLVITNSSTANNGLTLGVDSSENAFIWNGSNTELRFAANNAQKMVILANGNVGISASSPETTLHVDGNVAIKNGSNYSGYFDVDGAVTLYHNGSSKIATTSTGVSVTGTTQIGTDVGSYTVSDFNLFISNGANPTTIALYDDSGAYNSALIKYDTNVLSLGLNDANSANTLRTDSSLSITNSSAEFGGDVALKHDGAVLSFGANSEVTLTHEHNQGLKLNSSYLLYFNGTNNWIHGPTANELTLNGNQTISFDIGGTQKQQFDSSGNVKILTGNLQFGASGSETGQIEISSSNLLIRSTGDKSGIRFDANGITPFKNGSEADDAIDLGYASGRFDDLYATNGTIQTSDENEKQDIASMTTAELAVGKRLSSLFKTFRWKSKVTEKTDKARTHSGIIAQQVKAAFEAESLDATKYALFCSNTWTDNDGKEQTRMGVRYPELLSFIASYNESRFTAIEARLTALEGS